MEARENPILLRDWTSSFCGKIQGKFVDEGHTLEVERNSRFLHFLLCDQMSMSRDEFE